MTIPALLLAGSLALAERPHVVILGPAADHEAVVRMRGELAMLGIDVDVLVQARDGASLEAVARRMGAAAALRIEVSPPAIVLWVDPAVSPVSPAEVRVGGAAEERDPALLALRAVEVLRARLLKVPPGAGADGGGDGGDAGDGGDGGLEASLDDGPAADVEQPPADAGGDGEVPATVIAAPSATAETGRPPVHTERPAPRPIGFSAGPAVLLSPGGVPAAFQVRAGAEWNPIPRLGVEVLAYFPVTAGTVNSDEGSIDLRALAVGGGLRVVLTDPGADLSAAAGLGAAAMMLSFSGKAEGPYMGESGTRWATAPYASVSAGYRLHPRVSLRLDLLAALVRPEPVLRIAGQEVATFAQPLLVIPSLGVEVRP
jgi:hypothetical protein